MNRHSPFGLEVLASLKDFPQYHLEILEKVVYSYGGKGAVEVELSIECGLLEDHRSPSKPMKKKNKTFGGNVTAILTVNSDMDLIDFRRIPCVMFLFQAMY